MPVSWLMSLTTTPTEDSNHPKPKSTGTKQIKTNGKINTVALGAPISKTYPASHTPTPIRACISAVVTVMTGKSSSGNTTFLTKLGLSVISVVDFVSTSENELNTIKPANSMRAYSLVLPEKPQRALRMTPKAMVYTVSKNKGCANDQTRPPKEPRYFPENSRLVSSMTKLR